MILRSRIVVPVGRPPIADGAVSLSGPHLQWVGPYGEIPESAKVGPEIDLGEMILLPGLINVHCHLDYTDLFGRIAPPKGFADWIQAIVAWKANWTLEQYAASWKRGAGMLLRYGTTTVADIEAVPELLPAAWQATPLRVISFRELIHVQNRQSAADLVERAVNDWLGLPEATGRVGLSPHAPYTATNELLECAARAAQRRKWRLVTHVAESEQEFEMYMYRHGPMYDWLKNQRDMKDCGHGSPVQHLERCGYLDENLLAVHVNYLWRHDAVILAQHGVSVVHCPRSHDYFRHLAFPHHDLASAGVNLCLGTDSLATVRPAEGPKAELNLFAELQAFSRRTPELAPEVVLAMVTTNAARALGRAGQLGALVPGGLADLIVLPYAGALADAVAAVLEHSGPVAASMIHGQWALPPKTGQG